MPTTAAVTPATAAATPRTAPTGPVNSAATFNAWNIFSAAFTPVMATVAAPMTPVKVINGLLAILNATDADYQSLTASINNCTGAAKRMADIKMDNLRGQLTLMDSA